MSIDEMEYLSMKGMMETKYPEELFNNKSTKRAQRLAHSEKARKKRTKHGTKRSWKDWD